MIERLKLWTTQGCDRCCVIGFRMRGLIGVLALSIMTSTYSEEYYCEVRMIDKCKKGDVLLIRSKTPILTLMRVSRSCDLDATVTQNSVGAVCKYIGEDRKVRKE